MNKTITTGRRYLKDDVWHDDNGPIPDTPREWDLPMTDEEITIAALSDPDCQPLTEEQLARPIPNPPVRQLRRRLGLSMRDFADRFQIPFRDLRDWELERSFPDKTAEAYLAVIAAGPEFVEKALRTTKVAAE